MSILDRKVLAQDQPQYEELSKRAREKQAKEDEAKYNAEVERVNKENIEIEKQNAEAEAKYQKELEEYNKQKALAEAAEVERTKFDREIGRLIAEKGKTLNDAHYAVFGPGGSGDRSEYNENVNKIGQNYDMAINKVVEQKRIVQGYEEFAALYPGQPIPRSVQKAFVASRGSTVSIGTFAQNFYEGKAAKAEYDRQTSIQKARTAPSYTPQQSVQIQAGSAGLLGSPTPEMKARGDQIKPTAIPQNTVFPFTPYVAQDKNQVRGLTNVKTVETIYGGQQIETNPRAYVKGLERNIAQPGTPIRTQSIDAVLTPEKPVYSFQNISEVKEAGAVALLEFQSQLKTQTAPSAGVYKEILREQGLKETPLTKRIIETYASKPVIEYSTRAEAFGLGEAKGNKPFYVNPLTGESFDTQTLKGNQKLAESLGYKFEASKPTDKLQGPWSFGFPQNYYVIPDAFGVPRTDRSGNPILLKSEETAKKLSERLSQSPSYYTIPKDLPFGGNTIKEIPEKEKPLSSSGERFEYILKKIEEQQIKYAKYNDDSGKLLHAGLEIGKDVVGTGAFLENLSWQGEALVRGGTPKTREIKIPEILSFNVADDAFSGKFEKIPSTVKAYESKYGQGSPIGAIGVNAIGLPVQAGGKLLSSGGRVILKTVLRQDTKIIKKESIALTVKGGSRSAQWDASENIITSTKKGKVPVPKGETVGIRPPKIEKLEPNPYGKERKIPYALRQAQEKIVSQTERLKDSFQVLGAKTRRMVKNMNTSPNLTIIESRNVTIPNITKPERTFSKIDAMKVSLGIYTKKTIKPFVRGMGEVWQGNAERVSLTKQRVPKPQTKFGQYLSEQRIQRKIFVQKVKNIKVPELKTPEPIKRAKKGLQGYAFMQKKRFGAFRESVTPTLPKISFETKAARKLRVSNQLNLFRQKESLQQSKDAMRKVLEGPVEKPKEIVEFKSKNTLSNIKSSLKGIEEPIDDFFSKVKSWQKAPQLKGLIQGVNPLFGKVKGLTSRQEFANLLKDNNNLPQTRLGKFPFRSKKDVLFRVSYDEGRQFFLSDIQKIRGKGLNVIEQKNKMFDIKKGSYNTSDIGFELLRNDLASMMRKPRGISRIKADTQSLVRRGKLRVSAEIKSGKIKNIFIDLNLPKAKSFVGLKTLKFRSDINDILFKSYRFRDLQKSERYSAIFSKPRLGTSKKRMDNLFVQTQQVGSEIKTGENINFVRNEFVVEKSVKDLIGEGVSKGGRTNKARLEGLKNLGAPLNPLNKIQYKNRELYESLKTKETEFDRLMKGIKQSGVPKIKWKLNESDILNVKLAKDLLKDNEKYRAIGITAGAGSIGLLSTQQEAEAIPFPQILVRSGGQVLIQESKPNLLKDISIPYISTKLFGKPETVKGEEKYRLESKPETKLSTIPKIKLLSTPLISQYQPQKLQESVKLSTISRQKLGTPQKLVQRERQKTETIQRQKFVITPSVKQAQKQTPKLATPSPLKQPQKQTPSFKLKQPIKLTLRYRDPPPPKPPRLIAGFFKIDEKKKPEPRKPQPGSKADFLGNVPESQIGGIFNRIETTYGQRKINRLLAGDVRETKGRSRAAPRRARPFVEGKGKDPFGFKNESKKKRTFKLSL